LGLFTADDADEPESVLASMPLRIWRSDEVILLQPHPNDPNLAGIGLGRECLIAMTIAVPDGTASSAVDDKLSREAQRARELSGQGHLRRLWALPAEEPVRRTLGLWNARDPRFTRLTNTEENPMATVNPSTKPAQIRLARRSPAYWRVTIDNPPINVMGPEMVQQFQEVINALEADEHVRVVVFDSAVDDYFLNHSDFEAKLEDLTALPAGPTGLPPWPDFLARLTRVPVVSIALIRGRATGNGSEITLACDMSFASREKAILSQWEVGVGMVAGGGPMARLPQLIGRNRALEVLLSSDDIRGDQAEAYGYVNRALPDADLDAFVEALATRIAGFDKWAIANTKRLVNTSLPPDVELGAGWDACIASLGRPAAQDAIKALMARGFHKPGDVENRLGSYVGQIAR
jgi:enoyl-CoA hydratase/carnithine racemase/muconolactone delta-isomerase